METVRQRIEKPGKDTLTVHWMIPDENGPVISGGIPLLGIPGGTYTVACDPAVRNKPNFVASAETHAVSCPQCMRHPTFHEKYEPRPSVKRYEEIPEEVRKVLEEFEAKNAIGGAGQGV